MVIDGAWPQRVGDDRQSRAMIEDEAHRQLLLAVGGELGPVLRHRFTDIHQPPIDQQAEGKPGDPLGDRHHADDRVVLPFVLPRRILPAAPHVNDRSPVHDDAHGRADFVLYAVVLDERLQHCRVLRLAMAVDGHQAIARAEGFVESNGHRD
jgi:hypothetical protein